MSYLKITGALMSLCLVMFLTSCTSERIVYVNQPKLPVSLTKDCLPNLPKKNMTFGDSLTYNEHLLSVIEQCNKDKMAIRAINNGN